MPCPDHAPANQLLAQENLANASHVMVMLCLRANHAKKQAIANGEFTGTWAQLVEQKELLAKADAERPAWLQRLSADDLRALEAEGVL